MQDVYDANRRVKFAIKYKIKVKLASLSMNFIPAGEFLEFVAIQQTEEIAAGFLFVLLIIFSDIDNSLCGW